MPMRTQDARAIFESLWARIAEAPTDDERHRKFIDFVAGNNLAKWGIDRYREAERQGLIDAAEADRHRKVIAEKAAAVVFFRAPQEEKKKAGALARWGVYLMLSGIMTLLIGLVTDTAVWPGFLMTLAGFVAYVVRMFK